MADTCQTSPRERPKNLGLSEIMLQIRLPLPGKLSILHRVSGVLLFLMLGPLLYCFQLSVTSPGDFAVFKSMASEPLCRALFAVIIWAYLHHICAGIRFLLLDMHVGIDLASARLSAAIAFAVSITLTLILCWRILL
ncbi:MAG: succinate dehydrogenase, cytochrome b556 subunit [Betaproteobacteria bacterium]|nr:succinate dehydrogenase, cytochrome b556 subunit [Betaproteobacteria bacterium]